jgi:hypothetical protein
MPREVIDPAPACGQRLSFRDGLNTRSTWRFNALMMPMRANIGGPSCSAAWAVADQNRFINRSAAKCASASEAKSSGVTTLTTVSPPALFRALGKMAARQCPGLRRYVTIEDSETFAIDRLGGQNRSGHGAMSTGLLTVLGRLAHAFDRHGPVRMQLGMRT